jgi:FkbM family methyltransferase
MERIGPVYYAKVMAQPIVSYSQRHEDINLLRALGGQAHGFYIDIGAGHPVYDNVSFAFYLKGWRGVAVEPNTRLHTLARAIRPRDENLQMLIGATKGEADFHLVDDYHGFSTTIAQHAKSARSDFGKGAQTMAMPMTTLAALCAQHVKGPIDFLKIDVEGAESDVIAGGDWKKYRPTIVLAEALAPFSQVPAHETFERTLTDAGYRYVLFDSLNRYYVVEEAPQVAQRLEAAAASGYDDVVYFREHKLPLHDTGHPDHALARLLEKPAMARLPLLDRTQLVELLTADLPGSLLDRPASRTDITTAHERLFGTGATPSVATPAGITVRQLYAALAETDEFRAALGRISASYAW